MPHLWMLIWRHFTYWVNSAEWFAFHPDAVLITTIYLYCKRSTSNTLSGRHRNVAVPVWVLVLFGLSFKIETVNCKKARESVKKYIVHMQLQRLYTTCKIKHKTVTIQGCQIYSKNKPIQTLNVICSSWTNIKDQCRINLSSTTQPNLEQT